MVFVSNDWAADTGAAGAVDATGAAVNVQTTIASPMTTQKTAIGSHSGIFRSASRRFRDLSALAWQEHDEPGRGGARLDVGRSAQRHSKNTFSKAINAGRVRHFGPLRRLSPGVVAKPRQS